MGWMPQPKDKDWLNGYKNKTPIYVVHKRPTSKQGTHTDWKWRAGKRYSMQIEIKRAGVAILISDKIDFKTKTVKRDKEGHYIMIKGSIQEEDITITNIYAPNIGAPQYVRQMLTSMKGEINISLRLSCALDEWTLLFIMFSFCNLGNSLCSKVYSVLY